MSTKNQPFLSLVIDGYTRTNGVLTMSCRFRHGHGGDIKKTITVNDLALTATDELGVPLTGATLTTFLSALTTFETAMKTYVNAQETAHKFDIDK